MKLLCIGGTGLLSSAVVEQALESGIEVTLLNRGKKKKPNEKVSTIIVDFYEKEKVEVLLNGLFYDAIIDFISITNEQLRYSFNLLKDYTKQFVFISSCAVYNTDIDSVKEENSEKIQKLWKYSQDKYDCECFLITEAKKSGCAYTIIRPSVTYGDMRIPYGVMPPYGMQGTFIQRILNDKPIITWNQGKNRTNLLRVEDFSKGVVGLLGNTHAYNEAVNVCGDSVYSWNEVLIELEKILNKHIIRFDIPVDYYGNETDDPGEIIGGRGKDSICSNKKIKSLVKDFNETIDLHSGLSKSVNYYMNNNWVNGMDYIYDAETDRIIKKYCKLNKIRLPSRKLHFIDYLGEKRIKNYVIYFCALHKLTSILNFAARIKIAIKIKY